MAACPDAEPRRVLIVASPYYAGICASLVAGAKRALAAAGADVRHVEVAGALEIPPAIAIAASWPDSGWRPDGFVAIGCVIRGETSHYDVVVNESARGLMNLGTRQGLAIGNAVLTVDNIRQAGDRADPEGRDAGGHAARACLSLLGLRREHFPDGAPPFRRA